MITQITYLGQYVILQLESVLILHYFNFKGIIIQGGFLRDINNDLFEFIETWVTEFLVSQSSNGQTFVFLGDQEIKVSRSLLTLLTYDDMDLKTP